MDHHRGEQPTRDGKFAFPSRSLGRISLWQFHPMVDLLLPVLQMEHVIFGIGLQGKTTWSEFSKRITARLHVWHLIRMMELLYLLQVKMELLMHGVCLILSIKTAQLGRQYTLFTLGLNITFP